MLRMLTAGESHGPCLTVILDGYPSGVEIDAEQINLELARRQKGYGRGGRMSIEKDRARIIGGVLRGKSTGAPIALQIENRDWANWQEKWENDSLERLTIPRPGHADLPGMVKYQLDDARLILERASARETAARVAAGAVSRQLLRNFNIQIGGYVEEIGGVRVNVQEEDYTVLFRNAEANELRCPDASAVTEMIKTIDRAGEDGETLGGVFTIVALGVPVGLGSHVQWDRRLSAKLATAIMSIPAIKGVEFGDGFETARKWGRQAHDDLYPAVDGSIFRKTNHAGGIEGGMSNGEPIVIRAAMKPIATTKAAHESVDYISRKASTPIYQRSDVCAVPAASLVGEAMVAFALAQEMIEKFGGDSLAEMKR